MEMALSGQATEASTLVIGDVVGTKHDDGERQEDGTERVEGRQNGVHIMRECKLGYDE